MIEDLEKRRAARRARIAETKVEDGGLTPTEAKKEAEKEAPKAKDWKPNA